MTKVAVGSDIHVEFGGWPKLPDRDTPLLILAGDTGTQTDENRWFREIDNTRSHMATFHIPGNHWGYDRTPWDMCTQTKLSDVYGVNIVGATLWTDFALNGEETWRASSEYAWNRMNDYRTYVRRGQFLEPEHTREWNRQHVLFLQQNGKNADIVVTHHAPSAKSIAPYYQYGMENWATNPAYASNLDWLVEELQPKFWIHGHMHDACEYMIGKTTVICNPRGYPGQNRGWDWKYIEV